MSGVAHYFITTVFFILTIICIYKLTISLQEMDVDDKDENAVQAQKYLTRAVTIGWITLALIGIALLSIFFIGLSNGFKDSTSMSELRNLTGAKTVLVAIRILTFSALIFISVVVSALCYATNQELKKSNNSERYKEQTETCEKVGHFMVEHLVVFMIIQFIVFVADYIKKKYKENQKSSEEEEIHTEVDETANVNIGDDFEDIDLSDEYLSY